MTIPKADRSGNLRRQFADERTLRTRAMGTPFRVRWDAGHLVVTPQSGRARTLELDEMRACWPYVRAGSPKSEWRHLSGNSSYIEAIYDDLREAGIEQHPPRSAAPPQEGASAREAIRRASNEVERLREELGTTVAARNQLQLHLRQAEVARDAATARSEALQKAMAQLPDQSEGLRQRIAALEQELDAEHTARGKVEADLLTAENAANAAANPVRGSVILQAGEVMVPNAKLIRPDLLARIKRAAARVYRDPDASVAESRRTLESAIEALSTPESISRAPSVSFLLEDLYPLLQPSDWHMAKNLYKRTSALVHEGGATAFVALWIVLGTVQICELVRIEK